MTVRVEIDGEVLATRADRSLFDCADELGVRVPTSCRKQGKCRECLVEIVAGGELLSPPGEAEHHLAGAFRLACRARVVSERGEVRCHTLRRGALTIVEEGERADAGALDPAVTCEGTPCFGLAVDVGTTTVVVRLVDLESGHIVGASSFENPQRFGGSDVMARIAYDGQHPGRLLQRALLGYLAHAIEAFECERDRILEVVVAGNSTMRDLLFGLDVQPIGQRPYRSITEANGSTVVTTTAGRLRLPIRESARVYGMPLIRGHVGADAAACALAVGLPEESRSVCLVDIGTNTEVLVVHERRLLVASCPAGPAFEGGAIECGIPALAGAVESVRIADDGRFELGVIGGGVPQGICGSGLVDALAELLRTGRMNRLGRLTDGASRVDLDPDGRVWLTEADIAALAQAKGANLAGARIVLARAGIASESLDRLYVAGGFGRHLDVAAAKRIGLIPNVPDTRIEQVGNAAIEGATLALRSASRRAALEAFVRRAAHVELETDPDFFDRFVDGCQFAAEGK